MRTRNPDRRLRAVVAAAVQPEHRLEAALWRLLRNQPCDNEDVEYAYELHSTTVTRQVLQAWLVAGASDENIHRWLGVTADVLAAYRHLFFDVLVFRDRLDLLAWIEERRDDPNMSPYALQLLHIAFQGGVEPLAFQFSGGQFAVDPQRALEQMMTEAYFRSQAGRGCSVGSKEAQAALAQMNAATKAAQLAGKKGGPDVQQLLLKLRYRELTTPVDQTVAAEDNILH